MTSHFDAAAATWDQEPRRIALMRAVGEAILREAKPSSDVDVLDYGCGTGLVGLYLLPHVRTVTGADSSPGMLDVLRGKIESGGIRGMSAIRLDLEQDPPPSNRYGLIVTCMTLHHVAGIERVLSAFHTMLRAGGTLCIADLDLEPGIFHTREAAPSVRHHGFDRADLKAKLKQAGFAAARDVTAHVIRRPIESGEDRDFPVFLITARQA